MTWFMLRYLQEVKQESNQLGPGGSAEKYNFLTLSSLSPLHTILSSFIIRASIHTWKGSADLTAHITAGVQPTCNGLQERNRSSTLMIPTMKLI